MPLWPLGRDEVVTDSVEVVDVTVRVSDLLAFCCGDAESAACTVMEKLPEAVGVPEIAPLDAVRVTPEGRAPEVIDHV